jgi:hypothetical protein
MLEGDRERGSGVHENKTGSGVVTEEESFKATHAVSYHSKRNASKEFTKKDKTDQEGGLKIGESKILLSTERDEGKQ